MATAWRPGARISRNGCNCSGRGRPKSRSHASLPIPMTHDRPGSAARNPTARTNDARSPHRDRTSPRIGAGIDDGDQKKRGAR